MEQLDTLSSQISFAADGSQYLTFRLGEEEYGVEILKVQEIKGYTAITPVPNTPAYLKGVMNLRGTIVPVVDLRAKFGMAETEYTAFTVIIVLTVGTKVMGLIVDAVSDVLNIPKTDIQATPDFGAQVDARFISGMAKAGDKLVVLLDIDRVLGEAELADLGARAEREAVAMNRRTSTGPERSRGARRRASGTEPERKEFEIFRALVYEHTGISLSESKRPLLQARLTRRLRALGLATFSEYHRVLTEQRLVGRGARALRQCDHDEQDRFLPGAAPLPPPGRGMGAGRQGARREERRPRHPDLERRLQHR